MANTKPVGVAYSDPALTDGTTIAGGTVTNSVLTGAALSGGTNAGATFTTATLTAPTITTPTITSPSLSGTMTRTPTVVAAAGATQGTATAITTSVVIVTVTASTEGVKLPTAATGVEVRIHCPGTVGALIYPFAGDKIDASSTNSAVLLSGGKANIYLARNTSQWLTLKGA